MYDGNQVLRFEQQYKFSDLGGLSKELKDRKGTGNYDLNRTKYNIEFKSLNDTTISSKIYETLKNNNIEYSENNKNINLLNGAVITSGQDFFKSLGLKFKPTDRKYMSGEKVGQTIYVPDINSERDIPKRVKEYFNESYNFLENYVGKDNVIYASVHFDEDTPHMHFYFIPVVDEVKRKIFETDSNGKQIKKEITDKTGNKKLVPIQKKDENGNNMYEIVKGKFLNNDQFWKNKGGKTSYAKAQDDYNAFINSKGFNLNRGEIGSNKNHIDKVKYEYNQYKSKTETLKQEYDKLKTFNDLELGKSKDLKKVDSDKVFNPSKGVFNQYKENDIIDLINFSKELKKENIVSKSELKKKDYEIDDLYEEVRKLKSGKTLKEKNMLIAKQEEIIKDKNNYISKLENDLFDLRYKFDKMKKYFKKTLDKICTAFAYLKGIKLNKNENIDYKEFEYQADKINNKYKKDYER